MLAQYHEPRKARKLPYNSSSEDLSSSMEPEIPRRKDPLIEACRSGSIEVVKEILMSDPHSMKNLSWTPFYGLASTASTEKSYEVLNYFLSFKDIPQVALQTALLFSFHYRKVYNFKTIYGSMRQRGFSISVRVFVDICGEDSEPFLAHLMETTEFSSDFLVKGSLKAVHGNRFQNLLYLLNAMPSDDLISLVTPIMSVIKASGNPRCLEVLIHTLQQRDLLGDVAAELAKSARKVFAHSLIKVDSINHVKAIDILARIPELSPCLCTPTNFYQILSVGHVDLGIALRRRCPSMLENLDIKHFIDALHQEFGPMIFKAFADIFIMSADDFQDSFMAALRHLDREFVQQVYDWAKQNAYLIDLETRMDTIELAFESLAKPEKFLHPEKYDHIRRLMSTIRQHAKLLDMAEAELASNPNDQSLKSRVLDHERSIREAYKSIEVLRVSPDEMERIKKMYKRLITLVYSEDATISELKGIADRIGLEYIFEYLCNFKEQSSGATSVKEFQWYS